MVRWLTCIISPKDKLNAGQIIMNWAYIGITVMTWQNLSLCFMTWQSLIGRLVVPSLLRTLLNATVYGYPYSSVPWFIQITQVMPTTERPQYCFPRGSSFHKENYPNVEWCHLIHPMKQLLILNLEYAGFILGFSGVATWFKATIRKYISSQFCWPNMMDKRLAT